MLSFGENVESVDPRSGSSASHGLGFQSQADRERSPEAEAANRRKVPHFGVALFDNPKEMSTGWACLAEDTPVRFGSAHELSNDALWVTSLDWDEYRQRASKLSNLRRADYLRSSLTQIAGDLGRRTTGEYARDSSAVLARVLQQSALIAINMYGWEEPSNELREDTLADDIRRSLPKAPKVINNMRGPLMSAHQSYSSPDWPPMFEPDTFTVTLRRNRLDYARQVMANPVPDDAFSYISEDHIAGLTIEKLMDPAYPCLIEASVELGRVEPGLAALIAFGAQPGRRTGLRKWISQPEFAWLSRHTRVNVSAALIATAARPLPPAAQLPAALMADPLFSLSVSAGLIAECHWSALASPTWNREKKSNDVSSWAVWLRAADRALSFELAKKAHEAGLLVVGYGNGSLVLRVSRGRMQECIAFADENGIAHPSFQSILLEHGRRDLLSGLEIGSI